MSEAADFIAALKRKIAAVGGLRSLDRKLGGNPSKATLSRLQNGHPPDMDTARALGPVVGMCPCCGRPWPRARLALSENTDAR